MPMIKSRQIRGFIWIQALNRANIIADYKNLLAMQLGSYTYLYLEYF